MTAANVKTPYPGGRRLSRLVHLWLGLVFGLPLALVSLSGLPITYWSLTEQVTAPAFYPSPVHGNGVSLDAAVGNAQIAVPDADLTSFFLIDNGGAVHVKLLREDGAVLEVAVSMENGAVLGIRDPAQAPVMRFYDFHTRIWLGDAGAIVVLVLATALIASNVSGLVMWWPRRNRLIQALQPRLREGRRFRDVHLLAGVYTLVPILLAAGTTVLLAWPSTSAPLASSPAALIGSGEMPAPLSVIEAGLADQTPPLRVRSMRGLNVPALSVSGVAETDSGLWRFEAERSTGRIAFAEPLSTTSLDATLRHLHVGSFAGDLGRVIMAVAAVMPSLLFITGLVWWARRRRSSKTRIKPATALPANRSGE